MLNLSVFDKDDEERLEQSYRAIRNKEQLTIVTDPVEKQQALQLLLIHVGARHNVDLSIQNLFKVARGNDYFYVVQCLFDYGYPSSAKTGQSADHVYHYQIAGIAPSSIDLGKTIIRPQTKTDNFVNRFFKTDINIDGCEPFNDHYYMSSSKEENIRKAFDKKFLTALSKYKTLRLLGSDNWLFMTFDQDLNNAHSSIVEDVFMNYKFLGSEK